MFRIGGCSVVARISELYAKPSDQKQRSFLLRAEKSQFFHLIVNDTWV